MAVVITVKLPDPLQGSRDLEVPEDVPVRHLTVALIQALQIPTTVSGWLVEYRLGRRGQPFPDGRTLDELGVKMGDRLELIRYSLQLSHHSGWPVRGSASLRFVSGQPVLLDHLGKPELLVGRGDARRGQQPDIDLSTQPGGETVSRTHARLRKQGTRWVLIPLPSRNGTFVGGTMLPPHQPYVLRSGDVISFGAVRCVFTDAAP
ncbi:MAG: FHA domain-containing protein [Anaerolineae bacterium]|nr:FHA domain-containing protein [Anaerolineae bacterium]MCX8067364.1 FHA domain-containing protein [Anaerolineae bacterium]MDW7990571.1 FHA domain-containing protein [Anaerolineae bacterium]